MLEPGISPVGPIRSFDDYLLRVNPTPQALEALRASPDHTPFIMLNLLRFRPRRDPYIYSLYAKEAKIEIRKTDSFVAYVGLAPDLADLEDMFSSQWDGAVMPVYRRREAFLKLQESPAYQIAIPLRTAGTWARLLYVLSDRPNKGSGLTAIAQLNDNRLPVLPDGFQAVVTDLASSDDPAYGDVLARAAEAAGGCLALDLLCERPVVSEQPWAACRIVIFRSLEDASKLFSTSAGIALQQRRLEHDCYLTVLTLQQTL